jgi:hypothetical protein
MDSESEDASWAGETDPTHASGPEPRPVSTEPAGGDQPPRTNSVLLILYGVLGGIYLLYTIGWAIAVLRSTLSLPNLFGEIMYQFGEFLAIIAPALWLGAVVLLTHGRRPIVRTLWLVAGILVLAPWPFILGR